MEVLASILLVPESGENINQNACWCDPERLPVLVEAMTGKYDPVHTCVCCGKSLPGTRAELVARGCATLQGNGQIIFHCNANRHTHDEIQQAINAVPRFEPASKYRQNLI